MGDDTGVFPVVKRRNGKSEIDLPDALNLYIRRLGSFERGNFTRPIFEERREENNLAPFLFGVE